MSGKKKEERIGNLTEEVTQRQITPDYSSRPFTRDASSLALTTKWLVLRWGETSRFDEGGGTLKEDECYRGN